MKYFTTVELVLIASIADKSKQLKSRRRSRRDYSGQLPTAADHSKKVAISKELSFSNISLVRSYPKRSSVLPSVKVIPC